MFFFFHRPAVIYLQIPTNDFYKLTMNLPCVICYCFCTLPLPLPLPGS